MRALHHACFCGVVSLVLLAAPAWAQTTIVVVPFTGPSGPPVRNQIIAEICGANAECVEPGKATSRNKPDWKKAKKEAVAYFVTGATSKKGKKTTLKLEVMFKPGKPKFSKVYPVDGGELSRKTLAAASASLKAALGLNQATAPIAAPVPEPEPVPAPKPVETTPPKPEPALEASRPGSTLQGEPVEPEVTEAAVPVNKPARRQYFFSVDLGADFLLRSFDYTNRTTSNLRKYDAFLALPTGKIELFPLAGAGGIISGLGIEGGVSLATWLKSTRAGDTDGYPTSTMRIDAGLLWRIMPSSTSDLAFYPIVGIRLHNFTVGEFNGARLSGLPNLSYFGVRAGLGIDLPVANKLLVFFARVVAIPVFSSGEIVSAAFFNGGGSNFGIEGNVGVGVRIVSHLYLRASFDYTRYTLSFKTTPSDTYVASGAVDQYVGGTATIRFEY